MKIYDITVPVSRDTPVYEGDPPVKIETAQAISRGDAANVTALCFGAHAATHVDAPAHFIENARKSDALDLEKLVGKCRVVELDETLPSISAADVKNADLAGVERVLFKTGNSNFWNHPVQSFRKDYTFIEPDAARKLVDLGIKLVGIDYLSIENFDSTDFAAHVTFLKSEVIILESLDLRGISPGDYELICLPLKYTGGAGDGAPARTVLRGK